MKSTRSQFAMTCAVFALLLPAGCAPREPAHPVDIAPGTVPIAKPETVTIYVQADGGILWNGQKVTHDELTRRLKLAGSANPQPNVTVNADPKVKYQDLAIVMKEAQSAGLTKLGVLGGI